MEYRWFRRAGLTGIPKSFVIDRDGYIAWIGSSSNYQVVEKVVEYVISPNYRLENMVKRALEAERKKPKYDREKLLLVDGNGGDSEDFEFRSLFRRSDARLKSIQRDFITSEGWLHDDLPSIYPVKGLVQFVNFQLVDLYYAAYTDTLENVPPIRYPGNSQFWWEEVNPYHVESYGKYWFHPILEVADNSVLGTTNWREKHDMPLKIKYDYSVKVPEKRASAKLIRKVMQRDLQNYFDYEVTVETREMPCWKLTATPQAIDLLGTKTPGERYKGTYPEDGSFIYKNAVIKDVIWSLASHFGFQRYDYGRMPLEDQAPFVDETGLDIEIDYIFSKAHQNSFEGFRNYLQSKGLILTKSTKPMKVVVIRDPVNQ